MKKRPLTYLGRIFEEKIRRPREGGILELIYKVRLENSPPTSVP